jgi:hypothetical protein
LRYCVYTVHTAGGDSGLKCHVHLVTTKGGLREGEWVEICLHPPLAAFHIVGYDGQQVTCWYADTASGQRATVT